MKFADQLFHDQKQRYYADRNDVDLLMDISNQLRWKMNEVNDPSYMSLAFKRRMLKKIDRLLGDFGAGRRKASTVYAAFWHDCQIVSIRRNSYVLDNFTVDQHY